MQPPYSRIDFENDEEGYPKVYLYKVGEDRWRATGIEDLAGMELRAIHEDSNRLVLRGPSSKIEVQVGLVTFRASIRDHGKVIRELPMLTYTNRPGPWLINKISIKYENPESVEEFYRVDETSFEKGDKPSANPRYRIAQQDCRWLKLVDAERPALEVWFNFWNATAYGKIGDAEPRAAGRFTENTAPTAYRMTALEATLPDGRPIKLRRIGPRDWEDEDSDGSLSKGYRILNLSPYGFRLVRWDNDPNLFEVSTLHSEFKVWDGKTLQPCPLKPHYGPERWRTGERLSSRSALAADPFHGTGQAGARAAHHDEGPLVYRTSIKMPPLARYAEIRSDSEVEVDINHERVTLDKSKPHRVWLHKSRTITVTLPATAMSCPTLLVRGSTMDTQEWHPVHPDVEVHKKLVTMKPEDMHEAQRKGHLPSHLTPNDLNDLHKAVQGFARTIQYTHNVRSHGVHRDRAVHAPNLVDPHFCLKFGPQSAHGSPDGVSYHPMGTHQARTVVTALEAHPNFQTLDARAGQNFLGDLFHKIGEAGEVVVHTVEKVAGDVVDTAKHVVKDAGETIDHVGEHLAHGDILAVAHDLVEGGEHLSSDIGKGLASGAGHVLEGAGNLLKFTVQIAGEVFQFALDHTGIVGEAIRWVLEKAGAVVGDFLRSFLDVFGWEEVLHAHDVIAEMLDAGLARGEDVFTKLKKTSDSFFQDLIEKVEEPLNSAIIGISPQPVHAEVLPAEGHSAAMENLEWIVSQLVNHSPFAARPLPPMPWQQPSPTDALGNALHDIVGDRNDVMAGILSKAVAELESIASDVAHAPQHLLAAALEIIRDALKFGLKAISKVIDLVLDLGRMLLGVLRKLLKTEIDIPIVTPFYKGLTNQRPLTLGSLVSLLVAIPATLISKVVLGRSVFASVSVGQSEMSRKDKTLLYGTIYAVSHLAMAVTATVSDGVAIKDEFNLDLDYGDFGNPYGPDPVPDPIGLSKINITMSSFDVVLGVLAQTTANPVPPDLPYDVPHIAERSDPLFQANYWSHVVWLYQFGGLAIDIATGVPFDIADGKMTELKTMKRFARAKDVIGVLNSLRGFTHWGLMCGIMAGDEWRRNVVKVVLDENAEPVQKALLDYVDDRFDPGQFRAVPPNGTARGARVDLVRHMEIQLRANAQAAGAAEADLARFDILKTLAVELPKRADGVTHREWLVAQRDFIRWADGVNTNGTMPMNEKFFANLCDCLPEVGQAFATPTAVESSSGLTLIATGLLDVFGHLAEGTTHLKRTFADELL